MTAPPPTLPALLNRADALAGRTLQEVAATLGVPVPDSLRRNKGWIGLLVEWWLGSVAAGGLDFPHLGVELKTIPVDDRGRPTESTYICTLPTSAVWPESWATSRVHQRLRRVLWVPVRAAPTLPARTFGVPVLWEPSPDQEQTLRSDFETLGDLVALGPVGWRTGHHGDALQLRPKATARGARVWAVDEDGELVRTVPQAFYLRARFTRTILENEARLLSP